MDYEFRVILEKVSVASQEVVKRDTVKIYDIRPPKSILDLGLIPFLHEAALNKASRMKS